MKFLATQTMTWESARTKMVQFLEHIRANNLYTVENNLRIAVLPAELWVYAFMQARPTVRIHFLGDVYLVKYPPLLLSPRR
jgi:hypothetical protein